MSAERETRLREALEVRTWTEAERDGMAAAFKASDGKRGFYETLFAVDAWLLRHRAALSDTPAPASGDTARPIAHDQATALMQASTLPSSDCEEIVSFLNKAGFAIVSTEAPASGTGTREVTCQAWAPVNDSEELIDNESVGRSESQAGRLFLRGWPGGWPQASAAGWRLSRVTITAVRNRAAHEPATGEQP